MNSDVFQFILGPFQPSMYYYY